MRKRDLELRYSSLLQQLEVIRMFWEEFEEKLGESGLEDYINMILDEMLDCGKKEET